MSAFRSHRGTNKPYSRPPPRGDVNGQWVHDKAPGTKNFGDIQSRGPTDSAEPNTKLLVSNLHYEVTPKDLTAIFGQIGTLVREPLIRYDRSGRSTGTAVVFYETAAEATRAKKTYDGVLAKGQPMTIVFDTSLPRGPRRAVSAPHASLLNRIQKPPLADRIHSSSDDSQINTSSGPGPTRSRPPRRGGRGGARGAPGGAPRSEPKKTKTAEELDKELDAFFMADDSGATAAASVKDKAPEPTTEQDVEMA